MELCYNNKGINFLYGDATASTGMRKLKQQAVMSITLNCSNFKNKR